MRTPTAVLVAVALAVALSAAGTAGAVTGGAHAADANAPHSTADATALQSTADASTFQAVESAAADNLSVRVKTPRTIAKNVTQNYSVAVDGADGNVTATWTFERQTANGTDGVTKNGTTVQHTWADGGNATITVTVVDESGASVTKELTVTVVEYGSADDDPAGSTPFRFVGSMIVMVLAMVLLPAVLYLFVLPTAMTYLTDEFS